MDELIKTLGSKGVLKSTEIEKALKEIDRRDFVTADMKDLAYQDQALPIGEGQTISQPYTVVFMLELLASVAGEHIMEAGYGSGWQTVLLAELVGERGRVYALERIANLCNFGKKNIAKYPAAAKRIKLFCQNAAGGLPKEAAANEGFDAIIAAAAVSEVPTAWRQQLKSGGRLVYPKDGSIFKETKEKGGQFSKEEYPGFAFVPFVTD